MTTARKQSLYIAIDLDGEVETHIRGGLSDYATACGQALDGDDCSGIEVDLPSKAKITCDGCRQLFELCKPLRVTDFSEPR